MRRLIRGATLLSADGSATPGDILIEGDRLASVGPEVSPGRADEVIEARGLLALPGLVNCHNHAAMTLFRGYSDDLRLMEWLSERIWPAEARLTGEDVYWGTLLACAEMIRSGTTTFADMYFFMDEAARAVAESGLRGALARGLVFLDQSGESRLREARELFERWDGAAGGRIRVWIGPHAPYTCPPEAMRQVLELAGKLGAPVHIHLSETVEEEAQMRERYGVSATRYLGDLGLFEHHVLLAHCVRLAPEDIDLLRGIRGGVSHNPVSNLKLGCGVAPVLELAQAGVAVGLGTDGAGSATTLDMFEEIKAAAWLQKNRTGDPTSLNARRAIEMATVEGARVLGLEDRIGRLEPGFQADLILVDLDRPHLVPRHDMASLVAYAANGADVDTTIVAGRVLMRGRKLLTIDEGRLMEEANRRGLALVGPERASP